MVRFLLNLIRLFSFSLLILLMLRVIVVDVYTVYDDSMQSTFKPGNQLLFKKNKLPKHNEVVCFDAQSQAMHSYNIKRCVGLPGDTLWLSSDSVYTNGRFLQTYDSYQWSYHYDSVMLDTSVFFKLLGRAPDIIERKEHKFLLLTEAEARHCPVLLEKGTCKVTDNSGAFPWKWSLGNNRDNIKPFQVPAQGLTVKLTEDNIAWYGKIIKIENDSVLIQKRKTVILEGVKVDDYTFKHNYYYVLGDSRHHSHDSRKWGFVPQEDIRGTAVKLSLPQLSK